MKHTHQSDTQAVQIDATAYAVLESFARKAGITTSDYLNTLIKSVDHKKVAGQTHKKTGADEYWTLPESATQSPKTEEQPLSDQDSIIYDLA